EACPAQTCLVRQRGGPQSAPEATATPTPSRSGRQHRKWPPDCWLQPRRLTAWGEPQRLAAGPSPLLSRIRPPTSYTRQLGEDSTLRSHRVPRKMLAATD